METSTPSVVSLAEFRNGGAEATADFVDAMRRHSFVVFTGDDAEANRALSLLVVGTANFFARNDRATHKAVVDKTKAHGYPLWGTGYTHSFVGGESKRGREQFHVVVGAAANETPWPANVEASTPPAAPSFQASCAAGIELLSGVTKQGLATLLPAGRIVDSLATTRTNHGDSSVLDVFHYTAADGDYGMGDHTDPGLLTILPAACTPALEVFDVASATWVAVEQLCGTTSLDAECRDVIIFGGHMLEELTHGAVRAARHRVTKCQCPRISAVCVVAVVLSTSK